MKNRLRQLLWNLLGPSYYQYLRKRNLRNLSDCKWAEIGRRTYDNGAYVWRWSQNTRLEIGAYCSLAQDVYFICDSGYHTESPMTSFPLFHELLQPEEKVTLRGESIRSADIVHKIAPKKQHIRIGNDVWIQARVTVLPGVTVGNGATLMAGSVITRDVPDYAVVAGVPAKVVSYKHDADTIARLNRIAWWNWPEEKIKAQMGDFYGTMQTFLNKHG